MSDAEKNEVTRIRARLASLNAERAELEERLAAYERRCKTLIRVDHPPTQADNPPTITTSSSTAEKVALFRRLFAGRPDIFPVRWENRKAGRSGYALACANEWAKGICGKPRVKCGECPHQAFIPVSDDVIEKHLRGGDRGVHADSDFVAGVYPLLLDETCWFLAADFDKDDWMADAVAMVDTCHAKGVPAALERSRSGNGGHVWMFFSEPVPARMARQLGSALLTETLERRPDVGFASYDRFFPSQDTMPLGGFGNLIALPLQRKARERGNSVFIDKDGRPHEDQWAFLSSRSRLSAEAVSDIVADAESRGRILGVRMPVEDEAADEPWRMTPSRRKEWAPIDTPPPDKINLVLADQLYFDRAGLSPAIIARLIRLAAFQNPEFYRAQAMRLPTFGKPRIISCAELHPRQVGLPRGCLDEVLELIKALGTEAEIRDLRTAGNPLPPDTRFLGVLHGPQIKAFEALTPHDNGVLAATTAFGKTVVAAALIAQRARNALILVHRRELAAQWAERLKTFLNIDPKAIGIIGGGKRKPTGVIDIALIQSLARHGEVSDLVADYGHLIVDECHHLSATSFELVARRAKARYVLGLSATVPARTGTIPLSSCSAVQYGTASMLARRRLIMG